MTSLYKQFKFDQLESWMSANGMDIWAKQLPQQVEKGLSYKRFGDLSGWLDHLNRIPEIQIDLKELTDEVRLESTTVTDSQRTQLKEALQGLIPWRKGPFDICGIHVDTEWHSDWKWDRIRPHIDPLEHRLVLDVGCGNGYHMWRMLGMGAKRVIGVDPSPRFSIQFEMLKKLMPEQPVHLVPCAMEDIPRPLEVFDSVFSMGVLYHRKSPLDHLYELRDALKPGGQLILETLVVKGDRHQCLIPEDRYAKMRNVWFIPSSKMLTTWLNRIGFDDIRIVDETPTTVEEQRATEWMRFESLPEFLDPHDYNRTIEGYPAPLRATLVAHKPI
ncbi:MAG: tRNA 5-methoxyuridine(34)/uridine 5-oxyacetic acid(34) synthase CmoB [Porticoccaceae bacterium]